MQQLLHETTLSGTARKAYFPTNYVGGKTGTTNDVKDIWFVGLTANYTTGVWIGRDNHPIYNPFIHIHPIYRFGKISARLLSEKRRCRNGTFLVC
ncbi:hypothetical protein [Peribacillus frigoritolerans]|uniref:hypothetical protein n=1 Tax=Peribacillus frigoritolerans TaxID=450367 RepID=UPI00345D9627